jgi:hypothetical protein
MTNNPDGALAATPLRAPEGTKPYHPLIWVIVGLQILPWIALTLFPWGEYMAGIVQSEIDMARSMLDSPGASNPLALMSVVLSPSYLAITLGSYILFALSIVLAWRDRAALLQSQVPRPFHWAWSFLSPTVYIIGRSVIVRRRVGSGIAPMWVHIISAVIATIVYLAVILSAMMSLMSVIANLPTEPWYG